MSTKIRGESGRIYILLSDDARTTVDGIRNKTTANLTMNDLRQLLLELIYLIADGESGVN